MAKETQKAKIERLEQEVQELKDKNKEYLNDLTDLHNQINKESRKTVDNETYQKVLKERDTYLKTIQLDSKLREEVEQRYRDTIAKLQGEIEELNEELNNVFHELNNEKEKLQNLTIRKIDNKFHKLNNENKHNSRGAGRKNKLTEQQIKELIQDRKTMKLVDLAEKYNCSLGLVHKLTKNS